MMLMSTADVFCSVAHALADVVAIAAFANDVVDVAIDVNDVAAIAIHVAAATTAIVIYCRSCCCWC